MIEKISYRGWPNCFRLQSGSISLVVNASAGGRILRYERKGLNIIYEDRSQDGLMLPDFEKKFFDPDGGRFDYGPERLTEKIHGISFLGPYEGEIIDQYTLQITSREDSKLGLLSTRIFQLEPQTGKLKITRSMKNISGQDREYFFWGRTLVKAEGKLIVPVNEDSKLPQKWGRYIWGDPDTFECDLHDKGVSLKNGLFILDTKKAENEKYGVDSSDGWMAYQSQGLLFIKKYKHYEDKKYGESFGLTNIFYIKKSVFAEMEPVSPMEKLLPGEDFSYSETWYLLEHPRKEGKILESEDLAEFVNKLA